MRVRTFMLRSHGFVIAALAAGAIAACGGGATDGRPAGGDSSPNPDGGDSGGSARNLDSFFAENVQPRLSLCRSCHFEGGIADTADGERFMLNRDGRNDLANLEASWERMGGNNPTSRILLMASGQAADPHSGGAPWPEGSAAYQDMAAVLSCLGDEAQCSLGDGGGQSTPEQPLLTQGPRGAHRWHDFCDGRPDDAQLPADPRTLVEPGISEGRAVKFNAYWKECDNHIPSPETCGELRQLTATGENVGAGHGEPGSATMFAGERRDTPFSIAAEDYNKLWQVWGLEERPEQFDQLVAERYGSPATPRDNPYPLPGEDPNAKNGGSGQLPMVLTQLRNDDGEWTGEIGVKLCSSCHSGEVGTPSEGEGLGPQYGGAGTTGDFSVMFRDFAQAGAGAFRILSPLTIATNRGTGAIDQFQIGFLAFTNGDWWELMNPKIVFSQAIGTIKSPPWWNMAYRSQKFHGAVLPMDSSRIDMAANYPLLGLARGEDPLDWVDDHDVPFQMWAESLEPPEYPLEVDEELARQGAVLFHNKDLWAEGLDNPVPEPEGGNGSCAGCHGAYSPRYTHDESFLATPELAGVAARTVPMSVIGTDPVYVEGMESLKKPNGEYNRAIGDNIFLYCDLGNVGRSQTPEMLAPPLWGTWASAPYFHNGSVPNVWGVLDPEGEERPDIWKRVSAPAPAGLEGEVVMGYDTSVERAYDPDKLGWRYERLECGDPGTQPGVVCSPRRDNGRAVVQDVMSALYENIALLWNMPRAENIVMDNETIENRKIYNTREYSQGNQGHEFTSVLTDAERRALIEYLKTL